MYAQINYNGEVVLYWSQVTQTNFLRYRIYGGTTENTTTLIDSAANYNDPSKILSGLTANALHYFRVTVLSTNGLESDYSNETNATPTALAVTEAAAIPEVFALHNNYPNPFNPTSTIQYDLPEIAKVSLVIYDMLGREVITLVNQEQQPAFHRVIWDGRNSAGQPMATGMYIARLITPEYTRAIKMVMLK